MLGLFGREAKVEENVATRPKPIPTQFYVSLGRLTGSFLEGVKHVGALPKLRHVEGLSSPRGDIGEVRRAVRDPFNGVRDILIGDPLLPMLGDREVVSSGEEPEVRRC